jgi:hypothetical protein
VGSTNLRRASVLTSDRRLALLGTPLPDCGWERGGHPGGPIAQFREPRIETGAADAVVRGRVAPWGSGLAIDQILAPGAVVHLVGDLAISEPGCQGKNGVASGANS